jgi:hypothetical protein
MIEKSNDEKNTNNEPASQDAAKQNLKSKKPGQFKPRPFSFDTDAPSDATSGLFKFKGSKLKFASMATLGLVVLSTFYMILSSSEGDAPPVIPFAARKAEDSNLKPLSEAKPKIDETSAAKENLPPPAPVVEVAVQSPDVVAESKNEPGELQVDLAMEEKPAPVKKPPLPIIERIEVSMLLKEIDERKLLVEKSGVEYIVRAGEKFPGGDTVFIGFNRATSMLMTSTGEQFVATRTK